MLYSKLGSIPKPETDGTEGWVEVPDPPIPPEGMETVWWCPPGWVVRPPMPVKEGYYYKWNQSNEYWMEFADEPTPAPDPGPTPAPTPTPDTMTGSTGSDTISMGSAGTV